jgi:His-Xaa-Ser system protein HxsD
MRFSSAVYSLDAIKRAAYRLSDEASFDIHPDGRDFIVKIQPKGDAAANNLVDLEEKFKTEVLDADLRLQLSRETEVIRNTILSHVFSKTGLTQVE